MKRNLFETVKVIPGGVGVAVKRSGFLSAILAVNVSAGTNEALAITVEHSDKEAGPFTLVEDSHIGVQGEIKVAKVSAGDMINIDIDLIACKEFVKITATTGATATYALALGDPAQAPA